MKGKFLRKFLATAAVACLTAISSVQGDEGDRPTEHQGMGPLKPVQQLELPDFLGEWFQISRIPNQFETQCDSNTKAKYSISSRPGLVQVENTCDDSSGQPQVAVGWARVEEAPSVFSVTFLEVLGLPIFVVQRNFWVIGMAENKNWMVIGFPSREYGWILARTATLTQNELLDAQAILMQQGYNPCHLIMAKHQGGLMTEMSLCELTTLPNDQVTTY